MIETFDIAGYTSISVDGEADWKNTSIDYPTYDDWTAIQFHFLINEMPVTDASKKVESVIQRRQSDGKWICAVPYGYLMTNSNYRGVKIHDNVYSGFLTCGDCGSPMFSVSRSNLKPAYTCGSYHRRGGGGLYQSPYMGGFTGQAAEGVRLYGEGKLR